MAYNDFFQIHVRFIQPLRRLYRQMVHVNRLHVPHVSYATYLVIDWESLNPANTCVIFMQIERSSVVPSYAIRLEHLKVHVS